MVNEIIIYQTADNQTVIEVQFDGSTVWLMQSQMAELFDRERTVITKHINNLFKEGELDEKSNVQKMHIANSDKPVVFYNLDVIISVGYRVNSKRGTQFRQWATERLKDYLVQGYAINQKRLDELQQVVTLISQGGGTEELKLHEAKGMLDIITNYTQSFILLNQYDSNSLQTQNLNENITYEIEYEEAFAAIQELKKQRIASTQTDALQMIQKISERSF